MTEHIAAIIGGDKPKAARDIPARHSAHLHRLRHQFTNRR
jgi:hypothetical protein